MIVSILAVFMLVAISFTTSASMKKVKPVENKESPLFKVRAFGAIKSGLIKETIKTLFFEGRVFIQLSSHIQGLNARQMLQGKITYRFSCDGSCVKSINDSPMCDW